MTLSNARLVKTLSCAVLCAACCSLTQAGDDRKSKLFGNPRGGYPFDDRASDGRVLTGIRVTFGHLGQARIIKSVEPIYSNGKKMASTKMYGKPSSQVLEVQAKPGYAVGGIKARSGKRIDGFRLIFLRQNGDRLLLDDRYESRWFGGHGGPDSGEVLSDEKPFVGLYGRAGDDLDAIGLIEAE